MSDSAAQYRAAIATVHPELSAVPIVLHTRGWDSDAVEADGFIFKFPRRAGAEGRLRREVRVLDLVRPRAHLAVPHMLLHEAPRVFSEHRIIPGAIIETAGYDALTPTQKETMAAALAQFYADLHAIPLAAAISAGAEPLHEWPSAAEALPRLAERLPPPMSRFAEKAFAAYAALPAEDDVFGHFDGHGWNMAFDHKRGVLNGVYDFGDAGIGPRSREFVPPNLTSGDLTRRIVAAYNQQTGRRIDIRTVAIRTAVQTLSELAEAGPDIEIFLTAATRWHDDMQSQPDLRL